MITPSKNYQYHIDEKNIIRFKCNDSKLGSNYINVSN